MPRNSIKNITDTLIDELEPLSFSDPVTHVYNPLVYARKSYDAYVKKYAHRSSEILLLGMNPGPWGMAQTGVPFGDITMVRDWLGISALVGKPEIEHSKRPIQGFDCHRREVSGTRLWGWARDTYNTPERFFERFFVWNFCPLCFMEESGRNRTPDKLPVGEREALFISCGKALKSVVDWLQPRYVVGIGGFAEKRAAIVLEGMDVVIGRIPHPSPANPAANRGWAKAAVDAFEKQGIAID